MGSFTGVCDACPYQGRQEKVRHYTMGHRESSSLQLIDALFQDQCIGGDAEAAKVFELPLHTTCLGVPYFGQAEQVLEFEAIGGEGFCAELDVDALALESFGQFESLHAALGRFVEQAVELAQAVGLEQFDFAFALGVDSDCKHALPLWLSLWHSPTQVKPTDLFLGAEMFANVALDPDFDAAVHDDGGRAKKGIDEAAAIVEV